MRIATHRHALPTQCTWAAFAAAGCHSRSGAGAKQRILWFTSTLCRHGTPWPRYAAAVCQSHSGVGAEQRTLQLTSTPYRHGMLGPRYAVAGHQSYLGAGTELRILRFTSTPCRHGVPGPLYAAVRLSHTQVRTLGSAFCGLAVGSADTVCCGHAWCALLRAPAPYRARVPLLCV